MSAEEIVWEVSHRYTMLPEGTLKRIHVNQHHIRHNAKNPDDKKPPFTCKTSKANHKAWGVDINGPSRLVYSPDKPLACGAKVWIETTAIVGMSEQIEELNDE